MRNACRADSGAHAERMLGRDRSREELAPSGDVRRSQGLRDLASRPVSLRPGADASELGCWRVLDLEGSSPGVREPDDGDRDLRFPSARPLDPRPRPRDMSTRSVPASFDALAQGGRQESLLQQRPAVAPERVRHRLDPCVERLGGSQHQHQAPTQTAEPAAGERIGRTGGQGPHADAGLLGELDELTEDLTRLHPGKGSGRDLRPGTGRSGSRAPQQAARFRVRRTSPLRARRAASPREALLAWSERSPD
jgi:hypothetical protein